MLRSRLALVLIALFPAVASAQFTTFVPPVAKTDSVQAAAVAQTKAARDSITHTTLTNMKAWVDSAAGTVATTTDTTSAASPSTPGSTPPTSTSSTTSFSNGALAPNTASPLPLIALVGLAALSLGTVMLAGRPRA